MRGPGNQVGPTRSSVGDGMGYGIKELTREEIGERTAESFDAEGVLTCLVIRRFKNGKKSGASLILQWLLGLLLEKRSHKRLHDMTRPRSLLESKMANCLVKGRSASRVFRFVDERIKDSISITSKNISHVFS